jgi:putative glutamine amidotransferase
MTRPRVALLGRFSTSASALRFQAVVNARSLLETLWAAGAEPVTLLPVGDPEGLDWGQRLRGIDAVLMPGGGDVDPARYSSEDRHATVYDVDEIQDDADISLVHYALTTGLPMLAVCRGLHVLNVALGGTLEQHMAEPHRPVTHRVKFEGNAHVLGPGHVDDLEVSCHHHQRIRDLAPGLDIAARAADGTVEAVIVRDAPWAVGVQWHPEDRAASAPAALSVVRELVVRAGG